jgi:hypothetical protein
VVPHLIITQFNRKLWPKRVNIVKFILISSCKIFLYIKSVQSFFGCRHSIFKPQWRGLLICGSAYMRVGLYAGRLVCGSACMRVGLYASTYGVIYLMLFCYFNCNAFVKKSLTNKHSIREQCVPIKNRTI